MRETRPFEGDAEPAVRDLIEYRDAGVLGPGAALTGRGLEAGPVDAVFFGAHPDDEVWLAGGTLLALKRKPVRTATVCVSRGSGGGDTGVRLREYFKINSAFDAAASFIMDSELDSEQARFWTRPYDPERLRYWGATPLEGIRRRKRRGHELYDLRERRDVGRRMGGCVARPMTYLIRKLRPRWVFCDRADGGYGHSTHIAAHNGAWLAVGAAADPGRFPEQLEEPGLEPHSVRGVIHYQPVGCPLPMEDGSIKVLPRLPDDRPDLSYNVTRYRLEKAALMGGYESQFPDFWGERLPMMAVLFLWGGVERFSVRGPDGSEFRHGKGRAGSLERLLRG